MIQDKRWIFKMRNAAVFVEPAAIESYENIKEVDLLCGCQSKKALGTITLLTRLSPLKKNDEN